MKTQRAADLITDILHSAGVRRIYGIVGDSLNGITDAIRRRSDIEWIHTRHEEAAAFAAGAEAHLTGELAVCAGSCGPGNLHLINGLFEAHRSCVPVLAIAAQIPSAEIGRGYFQETHPDQLFRECSHYCELISHPSQLPAVLEAAIRAAIGHRGVAVVVIPGDVALQKILAAASAAPAIAIERPSVVPSERNLEALANAWRRARRGGEKQFVAVTNSIVKQAACRGWRAPLHMATFGARQSGALADPLEVAVDRIGARLATARLPEVPSWQYTIV